jgi:hypothetical protein
MQSNGVQNVGSRWREVEGRVDQVERVEEEEEAIIDRNL